MQSVKKIMSDFIGLCRVCGMIVGIKWLLSIAGNLNKIFLRRDLQPADQEMGEGPFDVSYQGKRFRIAGFGAISGIREMYVRDTYLHNGVLNISDGDTVVDLGANMGNFTNLALAHGPSVRVVALEPNAVSNSAFYKSVGLNKGFLDRTILLRAFIGEKGTKQLGLINHDEQYADAPWITEDELIQKGNLLKVDFLKCDIEGGEFGLLHQHSKLLEITTSLAIEIHAFAGEVPKFIETLASTGFSILAVKWDPDGSCTALAKRK